MTATGPLLAPPTGEGRPPLPLVDPGAHPPDGAADPGGDLGLHPARLALQLALVAGLVVAAGLVFANSFRRADLVAVLVVAAVVPAVVQFLAARFRRAPAVAPAASLALAVVGALVWTRDAEGWPLGPLGEILVDGPARILTSSIPAPDDPLLLAVPALLAWLAATASSHAVVHTDSTLLPALPPVVLAAVAGLFGSSGLGWAPSVAWVLVAGAVVLGALRAWWDEVASLPSVPRRGQAPDGGPAVPGGRRGGGSAAIRRHLLVVGPLLVLLPLLVGLVVPAVPGIDDREPVELRDRYALAPDTPLAISPLDDLGANYVDDPRTEADERDEPVATVRSAEGVPVTTTSSGERVVHVTQAVLDTYDGARWVDTNTYEAAGTPLPPDPDAVEDLAVSTHRLEVELHAGDGIWLPTVGRARELDARTGLGATSVDPVSGALVSRQGRPVEGAVYDLVTTTVELPPPDERRVAPGLPASGRASTAIGTGDTDLSAQIERLDEIATAATPGLGFTEQLLALERLFHNEVRPEARSGLEAIRLGEPDFRFVGPETIEVSAGVDPDADEAIGRNVPTGHALERILRFLYTPNEEDQLAQRRGLGTPEQFATAFVLLARSQGIPARVAVGYSVPVDEDAPTTVEVRARHAAAWPEVYTANLGWVPYAPTPADRGETVQRPDDQATTTTATVTSSTAEAGATTPTTVLGEVGTGDGDDRGDDLLAVVALVVLLALVATVAAPALERAGRRRRRRRLPPGEAVGAAWDDTAEHLVSCGAPLDPSMTASEAGQATGDALGAATGAATARLALQVEAAACGPDAPGPEEVHRAWSTAAEVRRNASRQLRPAARWRAAMDRRSARRYHRRAATARRDLQRPLGPRPMGGGTGADAPLGLDLRLPRDGVGSDPDGSPTATSRPVAGQASGR